MQGGESQNLIDDDVVLWQSAEPIRKPKVSAFRKNVTSFFRKYGVWINFAGWAFLSWYFFFRDFLSEDRDNGLLLIFLAAGIVGICLGLGTTKLFKFSPPNRSAVPLKLTKKNLHISNYHEDILSVASIKAMSPTYHEGAPAILLSIPKASLALITSERDSLLCALLTLRPELDPDLETPS